MTELDKLRAEHQPDAIRLRLAARREHRYLGDAIFGAVDGSVTTFAVVAGAVGAQLSGGVVAAWSTRGLSLHVGGTLPGDG